MTQLRWYLDTSAALKLLVEEAESTVLAGEIADRHVRLAACRLLETEMRRAAVRLESLSQEMVSDFLRTIDLYDVPPSLYRTAGLLPGMHLRSLDALHLAAAATLDVDAVCTYDDRLAASAVEVGVRVVAPQ